MPKEKAPKRAAAKPRSEKKKKDPLAPKRGLSAYMFFANEQRENVREENPGISFGMFPTVRAVAPPATVHLECYTRPVAQRVR